jgi:hypothetical protein
MAILPSTPPTAAAATSDTVFSCSLVALILAVIRGPTYGAPTRVPAETGDDERQRTRFTRRTAPAPNTAQAPATAYSTP